MKYLLFIVLLVAVLITAGCVGGNQKSIVTPTPQIIYVTVLVTPTPTPSSTVDWSKNPTVGHWEDSQRASESDYMIHRLWFKSDGTFEEKLLVNGPLMNHLNIDDSGTWITQGSNLIVLNGKISNSTYSYDPVRDVICSKKYSDQCFKRILIGS